MYLKYFISGFIFYFLFFVPDSSSLQENFGEQQVPPVDVRNTYSGIKSEPPADFPNSYSIPDNWQEYGDPTLNIYPSSSYSDNKSRDRRDIMDFINSPAGAAIGGLTAGAMGSFLANKYIHRNDNEPQYRQYQVSQFRHQGPENQGSWQAHEYKTDGYQTQTSVFSSQTNPINSFRPRRSG